PAHLRAARTQRLRGRPLPPTRRKAGEQPGGVQRFEPGGLAADRDEVTGARAHREAGFGRIPAVVPLDQLVDRVEGPAAGQLSPAALALVRLGHLATEFLPG